MTNLHGNPDDPLTIGVLGLGHVGLPTALGFAELGWPVVGADDDRSKAESLRRGQPTFYEQGLEEALRKHLASGRFRVAVDVPTAVRDSTVLFVCVGTPQMEDGSADLSQVERVAQTVARHVNGYKLVVEKSTTPVNTAEQLKRTISRHLNGDHVCEVAVNPEFLREGTALRDFLNPDRLVLGVESERARDILLRVYRPLLEQRGKPVGPAALDHPSPRAVVTDLNTAELIKHASNTFLATKISFINMVADLCEAAGADVTEVARGLGLDPRIGPEFLRAGVGFGGYCFPKDLRAFIRIGQEFGVDVSLLEAVERVNQQRVERLVAKLQKALLALSGKTIGVLGLAFKPQTDDIREATSVRVIDRLLGERAQLRLHDPRAMDNVRELFPEEAGRVRYCASPYDAGEGAHALLLMTEWEEYKNLDLARLRDMMEAPIVVDGRNLYNPDTMRALGFEYYGTGR